MPIKVAMIGAGSIGFTRRLMQDLLTVPELRDTQFAFTDISERNLDMVTQLCRRDIAANRLPATIEATLDRRRAVADADYVKSLQAAGLRVVLWTVNDPKAWAAVVPWGADLLMTDTPAKYQQWLTNR